MNSNDGDNGYGHRLGRRWNLHNFVHTGPRHDTPANTPDPIERTRVAYEGLPDSWWVMVQGYGAIAQAYTHLYLRTEEEEDKQEQDYLDFAQEINHGLWMARINQATYLMPDTVTPNGPLPGDQSDAGGGFRYMHDTDCLYWCRKMFDTYGLRKRSGDLPVLSRSPLFLDSRARRFRDAFCPSGGLFGGTARLLCQTYWRRRELKPLLNAGFPHQYLGMALGLTLDWIRYGWHPRWRQFSRKISLDGTRSDTRIYGDGKWNTLFMLIEAYRYTGDEFYLRIFDEAWGKFEELSRDPALGGLFPEGVREGQTVLDGCTPFGQTDPSDQPRYCYETNQESFLEAILTAYDATVEAGRPRPSYLDSAENLANRIIQAYEDRTPKVTAGHNGLLGGLCIRLARARTTLRRIKFEFALGSETLLISPGGPQSQPIEIDIRDASKAVVYMEEGIYSIQIRQNGQLLPAVPLQLQVGPSDDPDDQPGRRVP